MSAHRVVDFAEPPGPEGRYTGRMLVLWITHAVYGPDFEVPHGYALLSVEVVGYEPLANMLPHGEVTV